MLLHLLSLPQTLTHCLDTARHILTCVYVQAGYGTTLLSFRLYDCNNPPASIVLDYLNSVSGPVTTTATLDFSASEPEYTATLDNSELTNLTPPAVCTSNLIQNIVSSLAAVGCGLVTGIFTAETGPGAVAAGTAAGFGCSAVVSTASSDIIAQHCAEALAVTVYLVNDDNNPEYLVSYVPPAAGSIVPVVGVPVDGYVSGFARCACISSHAAELRLTVIAKLWQLLASFHQLS